MLSVCLNAALNRDDFNMCLCSPELDLYCRARMFLINNVAYIRRFWNCLGSWMLKKNFIPCTFFKSKSFTLLIHTNWHRKIGQTIWISVVHRDVSSIEYTPQKNVTVAMTVLFCVFRAVGSVLPLVFSWCILVCICDAFFLNLNT